MKYLSLIVFYFTCLLVSCIQKKSSHSIESNSQFVRDTSDFVIIPFDSADPSLSDSHDTELSLTELKAVDSLLGIFIADENGHFAEDKVGHPKIHLSKNHYKKQYVPFMTSNGQKKVWVNCFCSNSFAGWRRKIVLVKDGGSCFFNVLINLTDKSYSYFIVNGSA